MPEEPEAMETALPEENTEVDPCILLCHKIFLLSNPTLCDDAVALGEEVKQTVIDKSASPKHDRYRGSSPARLHASSNVVDVASFFQIWC